MSSGPVRIYLIYNLKKRPFTTLRHIVFFRVTSRGVRGVFRFEDGAEQPSGRRGRASYETGDRDPPDPSEGAYQLLDRLLDRLRPEEDVWRKR